jgi:uncharacterized protein with HEPN domain
MRNNIIIHKLIEYINKIFAYTKDVEQAAFSENTMMLEACVFCLSRMGELVKTMDDEFKNKYPAIPWLSLANLRNRIVHDYEGVNILLIWDIITNDLPGLKTEFEQIASA